MVHKSVVGVFLVLEFFMDQCPGDFKRNILFFSPVYSRKSCFFSFVEFLQWIHSDFVNTIGKKLTL